MAGTPHIKNEIPSISTELPHDQMRVVVQSNIGRVQCLAARDWKTGKWVVIATDSQGRIIPSPDVLPPHFVIPPNHNPLWMGTASVDTDNFSTVILTDGLGRVMITTTNKKRRMSLEKIGESILHTDPWRHVSMYGHTSYDFCRYCAEKKPKHIPNCIYPFTVSALTP